MFGVLGKNPKSQKQDEALLSQSVFILKFKIKQYFAVHLPELV